MASRSQKRNERLRQARLNMGWSQEDLAERMEVSTVSIHRWESGDVMPYPRYRARLAEILGASELGFAPDHAQSKGERSDVSVPLPLRHALVGREVMLQAISDAVLQEQVVALHGLPGVGKTTLALALAHDPRINAHFPDGILWAGLGRGANVLEVFQRWGKGLGLTPTEIAACTSHMKWAEVLRSIIGERRLLIILDDAWQVADVLACQVGGQACHYLLTTRFPDLALQCAGSAVFPIAELREAEGVALLRQFIPHVVDEESAEASRLVNEAGGLPLALILMGKYLQKHAYSGQSRRIQAALQRLHQGVVRMQLSQPQSPLEAHPSLFWEIPISIQASIEVSTVALPATAKIMLTALGLFPPKPFTFSEEVAMVVSAGEAEDLDALIDVGLVEYDGADRFQLHQTIVDYARLHFSRPDVERRFVDWAVERIEARQQDEYFLEQELHLLLAALQLAHERTYWEPFIHGTITFAPYLLSRGMCATAETLLQQAHEIAPTRADSRGEIDILYLLSALAEKRGDYDHEERLLQNGLHLARQQHDTARLSQLLMALGMLHSQRGDLAQAQQVSEDALVLARQGDSSDAQARILINLGSVVADRGNLDQAERYAHEAFALVQASGHTRLQCAALAGLAQASLRRSDYTSAERYIHHHVSLARQFRFHELLGNGLTNLGVLYLDQGQFEHAEAVFEEAFSEAREVGHRANICRALLNLSEVRLRRERLAEAEQAAQQAIDGAEHLNHQHYRCHGLRLLGEVKLRQGHVDQAFTILEEGITMARASGYQWVLCALLTIIGDAYLASYQQREAQTMYAEALSLAQESASVELEATAWYGLARLAAMRGDLAQAQQHGQRSIEIYTTHSLFQAGDVRKWMTTLSHDPHDQAQ